MKLRTCVIPFFVTTVLSSQEWLEVKTAQGPVRGFKHPSEDLYLFYNIPYATAPTGVNKFKAPLAPPIWTETFESIEMNFICPQNLKIIKKLLPGKPIMHENCLVANIFVPTNFEKALSVLVYVHGGGFSLGYGNRNKGIHLLQKNDFIMVTFNYRLGVHGFLCLGTEDIPGNAGMKDQVALLRWVQKNIASFGGNPDDVTLAGGSSGSASVDLIMLSKLAVGLFHRVIPESAGNLAAFAVQRDPIQIATYYAMKLNFTKVDDLYALEDFYKTAPLKLLTSDSFFDRTDSTFLFSPCVENNKRGAFLTKSPLSLLRTGDYMKVPMLYGFSSMEGMLRIDYFDTWKDNMFEYFADFLPADLVFQSERERELVAERIKNFYFGDKAIDYNSVSAYIDFFSHVMVTFPMLRAVQLHVEAGNNRVYLYEYNFLLKGTVPLGNSTLGVDHCAQSKAWLDDVPGEHNRYYNKDYQKMRNRIREIWHNFIKTG